MHGKKKMALYKSVYITIDIKAEAICVTTFIHQELEANKKNGKNEFQIAINSEVPGSILTIFAIDYIRPSAGRAHIHLRHQAA